QSQRSHNAGAEAEATGLEFVPRDAVAVGMVRPAKLLARPELAGIAGMIPQEHIKEKMGISADRIEQATLIFVMKEGQGAAAPRPALGVVIRTAQAGEALPLLQRSLPQAKEVEYAGRKYLVREAAVPRCGF